MEKKLTLLGKIDILGKEFTMYGNIKTPMFLATEIADIIGHSKSDMMIKSIDEDEKIKVNNVYVDGRTGGNGTWMVTEQGLYEICMLSRKPIAKEMKKKVKEYLMRIRLSGGAVQEGREQEFVDNNFSSFSEETKKSMVDDLIQSVEDYKKQISEQEPIVKAYKDLMTAQGYLNFIEVCAMVDTGRTKLFEFLRNRKVLTKQSIYNVPFGRFTKNGMFKVITEETKNGKLGSVTMVSPKGLNYIYKLIKKNDMLGEFNTTPLLEVSHA